MMTEKQGKVFAELRNEGYAVIAWTPEELDGVDPRHVAHRLIELGWEVIEDLKEYEDV